MVRGSRWGAALLVAVVTVLLSWGGSASATPAAPAAPGGCDIGSAQGRGSAMVDGKRLTFDLNVCEKGPKATDTGGRATVDGAAGAVQCTDMNAHTMAFLYALDAGPDKGKQVLVVISDGGRSPAADRIGRTEPRSAQDFKNGCGLGDKAAQAVTQKWQPLADGDVVVTLNKK
jgi:hypothetical protein